MGRGARRGSGCYFLLNEGSACLSQRESEGCSLSSVPIFEFIDFQFTSPPPPPISPCSYILSLALADLLVILTTVPLVSTIYTVEYWPWGSFLCSVSEYMKDVSIGVSVFTLTALSSDRYFAIVDPLRKFHAHGKL